MENSAKAVAERAIDLFNREFRVGQTGVSAEVRAAYVPEPVIVPFRAALEGTEYSGPTALDDFADESRESWAWLRIEPEEIRELGPERALATGELISCSRETGVETRAQLAFLFDVVDGRIAKARTYATEKDALAEAR